jgi:hypothetical protein
LTSTAESGIERAPLTLQMQVLDEMGFTGIRRLNEKMQTLN